MGTASEENSSQKLLEVLYILMIINYMIVTIVFKDNVILKYLRDIILFLLIINCALNRKILLNSENIFLWIFMIFLVISIPKSTSFGAAIISIRRYMIPIALLIVSCNINLITNYKKFLKFVMYSAVILAVLGIFQAQILGDQFLIKLGYPVVYLNAYQKEMLYNSFYFGGLGMQRVVATFSSSNICGLFFGITLTYLVIFYNEIQSKYKNIYVIIIGIAYILTFSRSNFLAMLIIILVFAYKYIPYREIAIFIGIGIVCVVALSIFQGENGIIFKIWNWVVSTFNMTDTSAAGRSGIWKEALNQVIKSPMGIGFGHVGSLVDASAGNLVFSAENSYINIALDTGWCGLICYFMFWLTLLIDLWKNQKNYENQNDFFGKKICLASRAILLYLMIVMCFSNHIQDMEIITFAYMIIGSAEHYILHKEKMV